MYRHPPQILRAAADISIARPDRAPGWSSQTLRTCEHTCTVSLTFLDALHVHHMVWRKAQGGADTFQVWTVLPVTCEPRLHTSPSTFLIVHSRRRRCMVLYVRWQPRALVVCLWRQRAFGSAHCKARWNLVGASCQSEAAFMSAASGPARRSIAWP